MDYTQGSILRALAEKLGDWRGGNNDTRALKSRR